MLVARSTTENQAHTVMRCGSRPCAMGMLVVTHLDGFARKLEGVSRDSHYSGVLRVERIQGYR